MPDFKRQLEELLAESVADATERTECAFDRLCPPAAPVILYGAGNIGKRAAWALRESGKDNICFCDGNSARWGTVQDGIPTLSPEQAIERYGSHAVFVVTVFNREFHSDFKKITNNLKKAGAQTVLPYSHLAWKFPDQLLPHFAQGRPADVLPYASQIREAFAIFDSPEDQAIFLEMTRVSLRGDYEQFSDPDPSPQYFPPDIVKKLPDAVHFADCGAYDGDTLRSFLDNVGPDKLGAWHAFEPAPESYAKLQHFVSSLPQDLQNKIHCYQAATGSKQEKLVFASDGGEGGKILGDDSQSSSGSFEVMCVTLDETLYGHPCNYIKLDVEGYELETLKGARRILSNENPIVAASIYHKPQDFFEIPLFLRESCVATCRTFSNASITSIKRKIHRYMSYFFECIYYQS